MILDKGTTKEMHLPRVAMLAAFLAGLAVHMFGLVNVIHNYDDIAVQASGYGTGISSGRWFLTAFGDLYKNLLGGYNLPWLNGVVGLALVSLAAYFLVDLFEIRSRAFAILLGVGCTAFPPIAATLLFKYTIHYYALAILMSVLAAYVVIRTPKKYQIPACILAGILTACALGIYQAYLPVTAATLVLYLIQQAMRNEKSWKELFGQGVYFVISLVLGLVFYFVFLHLCLQLYHTTLSTYQGVDQMGELALAEIPLLVKEAFTGYFKMPEENTYILAAMPILKWIFRFWNGAAAVMMLVSLVRRKAKGMQWGLTAALCVCFPIAVNLLVIMCANSRVYTLMVYGFVLMLFLPVVLFEAMPEAEQKWRKSQRLLGSVIAVSLGLVSFCYAYTANVTYTAQYYATRQVENLANAVVAQVRMTEGFRPDQEWAFLGKYDDPLMQYQWGDAPVYQSAAEPKTLIKTYSWKNWIRSYVGYRIQHVSEEREAELLAMDTVKEMPSWPAYGSVQLVDDVVVIKFGEE